jgi:hypothetical protein
MSAVCPSREGAATVSVPRAAILDAAAHLTAVEHVALDLVGDEGSRALGLNNLLDAGERLLTVVFGESETVDDERERVNDEVHELASAIADNWLLNYNVKLDVGALLRLLANAEHHFLRGDVLESRRDRESES